MPQRASGMCSMTYSVAEAARTIGKSKTTVLRAIAKGKLSATRDNTGLFRIDPAELSRVFSTLLHHAPAHAPAHGAPSADAFEVKLAAAEAQLAAMHEAARLRDEALNDLRHRLDQADAERRQALDRLAAAQERITALLTDQRATQPAPPRRSWLPWQRK
jgi:excisionase family DNA binding protein